MKKLASIILLLFAYHVVVAQWTNGTDIHNTNTGNVGIGTSTPTQKLYVAGGTYTGFLQTSTITKAPTDNFTYDGQSFGNYALGWVTDSWTATGPTAWFTSWGGIKMFSQGQPRLSITYGGYVGIGTTSPTQLLHVNGTILSNTVWIGSNITTTNSSGYLLAVNGSAIFTKAVVKLQLNWPDYVFDANYRLRSLSSLEQYINQNKHLPDMPSAEEMQKKDGVDLGEMNTKLLQKVEELTLYVIELKKENEQIKKELKKLSDKE